MTAILGTSASELLEGTLGPDTILGLGGADTLTGDAGADRLEGGDGDDLVFGYGGEDTLMGGEGNDSLFAAFGRNVVDGGTGVDLAAISALTAEAVTFSVSGSSAAYVQGGLVSTFTDVEAFIVSGGAGDDALNGGASADWLGGGAGQDTLAGGGGADTLSGGSGADLFTGSAGDLDGDRIVDFGAGDRLLVEGANAGTTVAYDGDVLSIALGNGAGAITINVADGLAGTFSNDSLGAIVYAPGESGPATVTGRAVSGSAIPGSEGADTLTGGDEADLLMAGAGDDAVYAGHGDDSLFGGTGDDILAGGEGHDVIGGGTGHDVLAGGVGDDLVYGGGGSDTVYAAAGADTVYGGSGDDVIFLGRSDGTRDIYASVSANGSDILYGFETGTDRLDLTASGLTTSADLTARINQDADGHATIDLGGNDLLTLKGVTADELDPDSLLF